MSIPSVVQGTIETEDGKIFELDSPKGATWLEVTASFRYEPKGGDKPYTVRKESGKGGDYWYGYRKMSGKLHKKYIGKSSEINTAKLEEISEALNTPPPPRITEVTDRVTDRVTQKVTEQVTDTVTIDRLTALELQVQALQESLEALRSELPGKFKSGNSEELLTITDNELQTRLGNLKAENETLRNELAEVKSYYKDMLQRSVHRVEGLLKENEELRSQLEAEKTRLKELDDQCEDYEKWWKEEEGKVADRDKIIAELRSQIDEERDGTINALYTLHGLQLELSDLKQNSASASQDLPEAADLLNRLKAKRKKSTVTLADVEAILGMIEG